MWNYWIYKRNDYKHRLDRKNFEELLEWLWWNKIVNENYTELLDPDELEMIAVNNNDDTEVETFKQDVIEFVQQKSKLMKITEKY